MTSGSEPPEIRVVCSECGTRSAVPFPHVEDAVARRDDQLHDGAAVAEVDPTVLEELAAPVAADLGSLDESGCAQKSR